MRLLPAWLRSYDRAWLPVDVMAGLTVWALMVPQALAYAGIAGVPVQNGLYVMPLAVVGYLLLGSSRHLYVGPSATVATLSASTVALVATASTGSADYIALTVALTLMVGVIYIAGGLARMGFVSRFFARPVLEGFIVGLGLYIAIGQVPKVVGIAKPSGDTLAVLAKTIGDVGKWEGTTVAVGLVALAALFAFARFAPKLPGVIIVVALAIVASAALDLQHHGVAIVGDVPTGFHFVSLSSVSTNDLVKMLPGALAIVIVGLAQALAIAKSYAAKYHYAVDANREMLGYGAANLGAGALQGYTVTGGLSASGAAERSGAKSPAAFLVSALMALLTILFLAGLFADLPEPVLGAVVIWAVSGMIKPGRVTQYRRARSLEFWAALGALLGVILIDILPGVAIGVALSFILLIHTIGHPHIAVLGRSRDGARFRDLEDDPGRRRSRRADPSLRSRADLRQRRPLPGRPPRASPRGRADAGRGRPRLRGGQPGGRDRRGGTPVGPRHARRARDPPVRRARQEPGARRAAPRRDARRPRRGQPRAERRQRDRGGENGHAAMKQKPMKAPSVEARSGPVSPM